MEKLRIVNWIDERFPLTEIWNKSAAQYYAPKNFNFWYVFGAFSLLIFVSQIVSGVWLMMYYTPTAAGAFDSIQTITRHVKFGWLIRFIHTTGASAFFIVIYLHMYRALIYGSHKKPRELLWLIGMLIFFLLMAESFTGYVLPWGQMSYWATKVIVSLFASIPLIGSHLAEWIQGDFTVSGITLHRFFAFHVSLLPMILTLLILVHLIALHKVKSNNPEGVEIYNTLDKNGEPIDGIPFHPYYTVKDLFGVAIFLIVFTAIIFFVPTFGGYFLEPANSIPASRLVTPEHIEPVWYLAPFYAVLRAVPNKLLGIIAMAASVAILFVLPWLDRSPVKSIRYKGFWSKVALTLFVISFIVLGYCGVRPPTPTYVFLARIFTAIYFLFFILMPFYTRWERCKPVPSRIKK